jgi:hypothetical protein
MFQGRGTPTHPGGGASGSAPVCPPGTTTPCPSTITLEIVFRNIGDVISGTTQTRIVGQKIALRVRTNPGGQSMSDIRWRVPGQTVKSYTQSNHEGVITTLSQRDLQAADLDFYWIAGGSPQTVEVEATVLGRRLQATVAFNVLAPGNLSMTSSTGRVAVGNPGFGEGEIELHFGNYERCGIEFTLSATAPPGGAGEIAGTQLIQQVRTRLFNDGNTRDWSTQGRFVLDTQTPLNPARQIASGGSRTWNGTDSPGTPLAPNQQRASVDDHFRVYFMYRPAGADSIWVTLMLLCWEWSGVTTRVGAPSGTANTWHTATAVSHSHNPSGVPSSELPVWSSNVTELVHQAAH